MATEIEPISSLINRLESEDGITRVKARKALVLKGKAAVPLLIEATKNKNDWTRWEAVKTLEEIGDSTSTQALIDALEDHAFSIRWLAAEGLIHIGSSAVEPLLEALIKHPESPWLREGTHRILHDLHDPKFILYIKPVISALEDLDPSMKVGIAATTALDSIRKV